VGEQEIVPVATATETVAETDRVLFVPTEAPTGPVTEAAPAGPVSDVHVTPCAILTTKFGLIVSCPPEALTRSLEAATNPEGVNGHP